jgi:hypothetical protein
MEKARRWRHSKNRQGAGEEDEDQQSCCQH